MTTKPSTHAGASAPAAASATAALPPPTTPFLGQLLGQAERATRALLDRHLDGIGLPFTGWVALRLAAVAPTAPPRAELRAAVARSTRGAVADAETAVAALETSGLLRVDGPDAAITLTPAGHELHRAVAQHITATTERLYGDLPAADLLATRRVLEAMAERAGAELARSA